MVTDCKSKRDPCTPLRGGHMALGPPPPTDPPHHRQTVQPPAKQPDVWMVAARSLSTVSLQRLLEGGQRSGPWRRGYSSGDRSAQIRPQIAVHARFIPRLITVCDSDHLAETGLMTGFVHLRLV
ncbi:unnamed protein product [Pleuronectes platessa]|uniref:Uncharacterized protein n=1 Tax=Pleuronectes platessa TaxID=8262 RepID=A0A9N7V3F1_PLEPL|nr:unnamed protein product [Pleuronectes platessa]